MTLTTMTTRSMNCLEIAKYGQKSRQSRSRGQPSLSGLQLVKRYVVSTKCQSIRRNGVEGQDKKFSGSVHVALVYEAKRLRLRPKNDEDFGQDKMGSSMRRTIHASTGQTKVSAPQKPRIVKHLDLKSRARSSIDPNPKFKKEIWKSESVSGLQQSLPHFQICGAKTQKVDVIKLVGVRALGWEGFFHDVIDYGDTARIRPYRRQP